MRFLSCLLPLLLALSGVHLASVKQVDSQQILKARNFFNAQLLTVLDHSTQQNTLVSPYFLHSLFSSLLDGAAEQTFEQLFNALGYANTNLNRQTILDAYQATFENLTQLADVGLDFANLLAADSSLILDEKYREEVGKAFGMGVITEDFFHYPDKSTKEMNDWVKMITKDQIKSIFDSQIAGDTGLILMNALRLNSNWKNQFDPKRNFNGTFEMANGKSKTVTYMTIKANELKGSQFKQFFGYSVVRIPMDNAGRLYFSIMLPEMVIQPYFDCCTSSTDTIVNARDMAVDLTIPIFKMNQNLDSKILKNAFESWGVTDLFDVSKSNLNRIDPLQDKALFVKAINHTLELQVNEAGVNGANAGASTIARNLQARSRRSVNDPTPAIPVVVNRPFVFVISDTQTNANLFTGLVHEP